MKSSETTFSKKAIGFFSNLKIPKRLPDNVLVLNPYKNKETKEIVSRFYNTFFNDTKERVFILGINPGRFGGGVTGISFTDPVTLEKHCGIKNNINKKPELSSKFVYSFIKQCGGVEKFYSKFFISALFPLALIREGKNYNYYDNSKIYEKLKPYLLSSLRKQVHFGAKKDTVICLGKKNSKYLNELNKDLGYFKNIITLEHPRFIMQYRLKKKDYYLKKYIDALNSCL
jgi:hypothetical protein